MILFKQINYPPFYFSYRALLIFGTGGCAQPP